MQLNIKDPTAHRMAQERAKIRPDKADVRAKILALVEEVKGLPVYDDRHPDEMLYDEDGLPKARTDGF